MDRIIRTKHASVKGSKDGYDDDYDSAYAFVFWSALIGISFLLSACGGGSSSGGSPVSVTAPAIVTPPTRLSLSYGPSYEAEYNNQRGLEAIEAATAYEAGYAGFGARLAVVDTGVDGHHDDAHWGIHTTLGSQIDLGALFLAGWHRPPHHDSAGQSWQAGYQAHMTWHFQQGGQLQATYLRRRTRYEKTLSYLLSPHRIVEKQFEISVSKPLPDFPHIIPFVKAHRRMSQSTNLRQHGKSEYFVIGLSFRLN